MPLSALRNAVHALRLAFLIQQVCQNDTLLASLMNISYNFVHIVEVFGLVYVPGVPFVEFDE
jgi:hypothetical protein